MGLGSDKTIAFTAVVGVQGAGGGCLKETQSPSSPKASDCEVCTAPRFCALHAPSRTAPSLTGNGILFLL